MSIVMHEDEDLEHRITLARQARALRVYRGRLHSRLTTIRR